MDSCFAQVQHTGERPLDELRLQIYPEGASRFELYEDDGRSNAHRQGRYALTRFECEAEADRVIVRIGAPTGNPSVVPLNRRYRIRLRVARPAAVAVEGAGVLPHTGGDAERPGWCVDDMGFLCIRPPDLSTITVVVTPGDPPR